MAVSLPIGTLPPAPWDPPATAAVQPACRNHALGWRAWQPADRLAAQQPLHRAAVAVCDTCPFLAPCRAWALAQSPDMVAGIWGGLTEADRARARRRKHYDAERRRRAEGVRR